MIKKVKLLNTLSAKAVKKAPKSMQVPKGLTLMYNSYSRQHSRVNQLAELDYIDISTSSISNDNSALPSSLPCRFQKVCFKVVVFFDCLFLVRAFFAVQAFYKPHSYMHRYHIFRNVTCFCFALCQVALLFFNLFYSRILIQDSLLKTSVIQMGFLVLSIIVEMLGSWVVSTELI